MTQQVFSQVRNFKGIAQGLLGAVVVLSAPVEALAQEQADCITEAGYSTCAANIETDYSLGLEEIASEKADGTSRLVIPVVFSAEPFEEVEERINNALVTPSVGGCNQSGQLVFLCE
ncbi:MAG: hypothetical protein AAFW84_03595 [Cyanobacteria bacterium J06635_15]